jgi:CheY-like chemotaxis protein
MAIGSPATDDLLRAVHALRDREESERLRQLGGILVHDLNNVLFALLGRVQLLERRSTDPATVKAAREILETTRLLEAQIVQLHAACKRDEVLGERGNARVAVRAALAEAIAALPPEIAPAALDAAITAIPSDAHFDGDETQVGVAIRQLLSIHRARANGPIEIAARVIDGDPARLEVTFADHGGRPSAVPAKPSLLGGEFALSGLPVAAAYRATRDFGGTVECDATTDGLCTRFSFEVRRGVAIARFDAAGAEHDCEHDCEHGRDSVPPARRVLVADDDPAVRAVLVAVLEAVGDDVDTLADPGACDAHAELDQFDVVILDAGGGGLEALARLRKRGVEVPVLVASGEMVERADDPLTRCAMKPIPLETLDRDLASLARLRARK